MKFASKLIVVVLLVLVSSLTLFAQKSIDEGKIVYTITYPEMEMDNEMAAMMPTEYTVYFKGGMSRSNMDMGMGISSSSITNSKTGEIVNLTDMLGTKTAMIITADEIKKAEAKSKESQPEVILTDETKEIAGYSCKKAIIKGKDNTSMELFYTEKIDSRSQVNKEWKQIKGFPMEYVLSQGGMHMKMTANTVSAEKVDDSMFTVPKEYKVVTREEMMKMMGGGE